MKTSVKVGIGVVVAAGVAALATYAIMESQRAQRPLPTIGNGPTPTAPPPTPIVTEQAPTAPLTSSALTPMRRPAEGTFVQNQSLSSAAVLAYSSPQKTTQYLPPG